MTLFGGSVNERDSIYLRSDVFKSGYSHQLHLSRGVANIPVELPLEQSGQKKKKLFLIANFELHRLYPVIKVRKTFKNLQNIFILLFCSCSGRQILSSICCLQSNIAEKILFTVGRSGSLFDTNSTNGIACVEKWLNERNY